MKSSKWVIILLANPIIFSELSLTCFVFFIEGECSELSTLLTRLMAQKGLWKPSNDTSLGIDQIVEHFSSSAAAGRALHIEPLHVSNYFKS